MKIVVLCPGSWTHGLNSPERGEGRWAQNYAAMLGGAGHEVFAASSGNGRHQPTVPGVRLIAERDMRALGPVDLYIDSSWWDGKPVTVQARCYVHVHWSLEERVRKPLPHGHVLAYPYPCQRPFFDHEANANRARTFALPSMFADAFAPLRPGTDGPVFITGRSLDREPARSYFLGLLPALRGRTLVGTFGQHLPRETAEACARNGVTLHVSRGALPYDQLRALLRTCALNLPVCEPNNVLDATAEGVPTVFWAHGGFFWEILSDAALIVPADASIEQAAAVVRRMLADDGARSQMMTDLGAGLACHQRAQALAYFNAMVREVGL